VRLAPKFQIALRGSIVVYLMGSLGVLERTRVHSLSLALLYVSENGRSLLVGFLLSKVSLACLRTCSFVLARLM
jgi:hypothetical protein